MSSTDIRYLLRAIGVAFGLLVGYLIAKHDLQHPTLGHPSSPMPVVASVAIIALVLRLTRK